MMPQDKTCSKYYLNGYSRFHARARFFAVAAAISSRVSEGFQTELMEDNRVASNFENLWGAASRELRWVVDMPDHMWSTLATVARCRADELKMKTIEAAHVAYHFIWRRVLEPAALFPWKLCRGDLDQNLLDLRNMQAPPDEPCASNLWHLLQADFPMAQLRGVLHLFGQCSWSSLPAEQQHGSLSLLHRWHPEYGLESLVQRSFLHQVVRLLPHESKLDKEMRKLMKQMGKLERANSEKVSGSHMLVQALVKVARGRKEGYHHITSQATYTLPMLLF